MIKLWKKISEWYNEDSEKKAELEEFKNFASLVEEKINLISKYPPTHHIERALLFDNAYNQRKMSEASKNLSLATFALFAATGILAYATILTTPNPPEVFSKIEGFFIGIITILLLLVFVGLILRILGIIFKWLIKIVKPKKK